MVVFFGFVSCVVVALLYSICLSLDSMAEAFEEALKEENNETSN